LRNKKQIQGIGGREDEERTRETTPYYNISTSGDQEEKGKN